MTQIRFTIGKGADIRTIGVAGVDQTLRSLDAMGKRLERAMEMALLQKGEEIMGDAKQQVPVLDGHLRGSGFVRRYSELSTKAIVVQPTFGGVAAPYAFRQHETPPYDHVYEGKVMPGYKHREGQKWKYLEDPARKHFETIDQFMAHRLKSALR